MARLAGGDPDVYVAVDSYPSLTHNKWVSTTDDTKAGAVSQIRIGHQHLQQPARFIIGVYGYCCIKSDFSLKLEIGDQFHDQLPQEEETKTDGFRQFQTRFWIVVAVLVVIAVVVYRNYKPQLQRCCQSLMAIIRSNSNNSSLEERGILSDGDSSSNSSSGSNSRRMSSSSDIHLPQRSGGRRLGDFNAPVVAAAPIFVKKAASSSSSSSSRQMYERVTGDEL
jgi:hypothetical protein